MNNIRMAGLWIIIFIFLAIFFWSLIPTPIVENSFSVDFNQPIFQNQNCMIDKALRNITFKTKYPAFLYFGSRAIFEVLVQKELMTDGLSANNCEYAFEINLEMGAALIEPNDRLIQPLADSEDQHFIFEIQPVDFEQIKMGDLWIYLNSTTPDSLGVNRLPLFVIPVEIELRSLLGISLIWLRFISLIAVFILLVVKILNHRSR